MDLEDGDHAVQPLLVTPANERSAVFSPDGRWIAYVSDESGRDEVYVIPAPPTTGASFALSTAGGREPVWSQDGTRLRRCSPRKSRLPHAPRASIRNALTLQQRCF